jgi:hypothetical protein
MGLADISFIDYFKEVAKSTKFQISATVSFGTALFLTWFGEHQVTKILLTILFLFPASMFVTSLIEKAFFWTRQKIRRKHQWNALTPEEIEFVSYYINNNTKTRYVVIYNGTYQDSGIINPLIRKGILYRASNTSEFRGESWMSAEQHFPFNIHDNAFEFFQRHCRAGNEN